MATFSVKTAALGNDGEYACVTGTTFANNTISMQFGKTGGGVLKGIWCRFLSVTVPQYSTISAATIYWHCPLTDVDATCNATIECEAADNPSSPTTAANGRGRARTTAVTWGGVEGYSTSTYYTTPDFATCVQEVVDRSGWSSGNALQVIVDDNGSSLGATRNLSTYDVGTSAKYPQITITYTPPGAQPYATRWDYHRMMH